MCVGLRWGRAACRIGRRCRIVVRRDIVFFYVLVGLLCFVQSCVESRYWCGSLLLGSPHGFLSVRLRTASSGALFFDPYVSFAEYGSFENLVEGLVGLVFEEVVAEGVVEMAIGVCCFVVSVMV